MSCTTSRSLRCPLVTDSCFTTAFLWRRFLTRASDVTLGFGHVSLDLAEYGEIMEYFRNKVSPQRVVEKFGLQIYKGRHNIRNSEIIVLTTNLSSKMTGDQIVNGQL